MEFFKPSKVVEQFKADRIREPEAMKYLLATLFFEVISKALASGNTADLSVAWRIAGPSWVQW